MFGLKEGSVRGFDNDGEEFSESIDDLDIYSQFLGEQEYLKMKENYQRALTVMTELCQFECDRVEMNAPIQWN